MPPPIIERPAPVTPSQVNEHEPEAIQVTEEVFPEHSEEDGDAGALRWIRAIEAVGKDSQEGYRYPDGIQADAVGQKPIHVWAESVVLDAVVVHDEVESSKDKKKDLESENESDFILNFT